MGTNFYTLKGKHLGKRSAAGPYCWDCQRTLCKEGNSKVHYDNQWFDSCPKCGKKPIKESLTQSTGGRELGFNKSKPKLKTGVSSCSSFSWALLPSKFWGSKIANVKDEYGRRFTRKQFGDILQECPIQTTDFIGREFS